MTVASRPRSMMIHRANIERNGTSSTDDWGQPGIPVFASLATDVPCRAWSQRRDERNDEKKFALVETIRCSMPLDQDVTEDDQIAQIADRAGVVIFAGPLRIDTIQYKIQHIEMDLRRIQS